MLRGQSTTSESGLTPDENSSASRSSLLLFWSRLEECSFKVETPVGRRAYVLITGFDGQETFVSRSLNFLEPLRHGELWQKSTASYGSDDVSIPSRTLRLEYRCSPESMF